jgi:hypothetical protein
MECARHLGHHEKIKLQIMSIEEEEIKVKDIENIFNKIIAENFQS